MHPGYRPFHAGERLIARGPGLIRAPPGPLRPGRPPNTPGPRDLRRVACTMHAGPRPNPRRPRALCTGRPTSPRTTAVDRPRTSWVHPRTSPESPTTASALRRASSASHPAWGDPTWASVEPTPASGDPTRASLDPTRPSCASSRSSSGRTRSSSAERTRGEEDPGRGEEDPRTGEEERRSSVPLRSTAFLQSRSASPSTRPCGDPPRRGLASRRPRAEPRIPTRIRTLAGAQPPGLGEELSSRSADADVGAADLSGPTTLSPTNPVPPLRRWAPRRRGAGDYLRKAT
jgi:hypothetical protein